MDTEKHRTIESQYADLINRYRTQNEEKFGLMANYTWKLDPRGLLFRFARYKFVSKMFEGFDQVLEVGCGDAAATRIVQQTVGKVTVTDIDKIFIDDI